MARTAGKKVTRKKSKATAASQPVKAVVARGDGGGSMNRLTASEKDFIKLVMDPCSGPLVASPFGSTENAYIWRLNYRGTLASNAGGHLMAALYPKGVYNNFGSNSANLPQCIQLWNGSSLNDSALAVSSSTGQAMPGLQNLISMGAQIRVTAGCIKMNYIGPANVAQGELYAWEGQGDENLAAVASSYVMTNKSSPAQFCINGKPLPITAGAEARLDYAKASEQQRSWGDPQVGQADVYCPIAVVGVSGGPASTNYVVEATLVVEWIPMLSQGIPAAPAAMRAPGAADRVANAIKSIAPLLVSASTVPLGGYAGAFGQAARFTSKVAKALMR